MTAAPLSNNIAVFEQRPWIGKKMLLTFSKIYGNKFLSFFSCEQMKDEWIRDWHENLKEFSTEQIKKACEKLIEPFNKFVSYPPTIGEFKELCFPSDAELNIPTLDEAFRLVFQWWDCKIHPFLTPLIKQLPRHFRELSTKDAMINFKPIYNIVRTQTLREMKILPKIEKTIEKPPVITRKITPEESSMLSYQADKTAVHHLQKLYACVDVTVEQARKRSPTLTAFEIREKTMGALS